MTLAEIIAAGPDSAVPLRLWELHRATAVGDVLDLPANVAARWPDALLAAVLEGAGLEPVGRSRSRWRRRLTLADSVGPGMDMVLAGLNPSVYSAEAGVGFARPGNRFWPAALQSGIVTHARDPVDALVTHRIGMTDLVKRATARAAELADDEYRHGFTRLEQLVAWLQPGVVCVVGLSGWRVAVDRRAGTGVQHEPLAGRPVYVMPNPSGLNAHVRVDDLAEHLATAAQVGARSRMA